MNNTHFPSDSSGLEEKIGYRFNDKSLLQLALTHSSYANEARSHGETVECNERTEFLGDSVLSLIASEYLYSHFRLTEGDLSKIRAGVVCEKALFGFARSFGLGDYLLLGRGEEQSGGRSRPSILADAFEALLAAVYLDGGAEPARSFLLPLLIPEIERTAGEGRITDYKTLLQQFIQQEQGELLEYVLVSETGPAHEKIFVMDAMLNGNPIGRGEGPSKRAAEQSAARHSLELFGIAQ